MSSSALSPFAQQQTLNTLRYYVFARILIGVALLIWVLFSLQINPDFQVDSFAPFYGTAVMLALMVFSAALSQRFATQRIFISFQFVVDAVFVSFMLATGTSFQNPFVVLYSINILAATSLASPNQVLFVTVLDVLLYTFVQILGSIGWLGWEFSLNSLSVYVKLISEIFGLMLIGGLSLVLSLQRTRISKVLREQMTKNIRLQQQHIDILNELPLAVFLQTDRLVPKNKRAKEALPLVPTDILGKQNKDRILFQESASGKEFEITKTTLQSDIELVLMKDITKIKEMEKMVEQEERLAMVGRLTSSLAHEIRNPLASLSGAVQLLAEKEQGRLHQIILREIKRINELVEIYLQTARPKKMEREWQIIEPMLFEIVDALNHDPRSEGVEFILELDESTPLWVDIGQFRQIVWNLLLNAIQAMPDRGRIVISNQIEEKKYQLSIKDSGRGIPKEVISKIFDPFFSNRSGGTGLGLAVVDQIIRAHGGKIEVWSEEGDGTEFILTFPIEKEVG